VEVGWAWRKTNDADKAELYVVGSWAKVTRGEHDFFCLEGYVGTMPVYSGVGHGYRMEGEKLIWRKPSRAKEDVYRKVTLADLQPPTATPSPSP
jgi:hypothetical protein